MVPMILTIQQLNRPVIFRNLCRCSSYTSASSVYESSLSPFIQQLSASVVRTFSSSSSSSSTSSSAGAAASAPRLTGRPRFYKEVDVTVVNPPWLEYLIKNSKQGKRMEKSDGSESDVIKSPVSAGVDGTQSATGVRHIPKPTDTGNNGDVDSRVISTADRLEQMLTPRNRSNTAGSSTSSTRELHWYGVTVDGRKISTPMGQVLAVPSETLAYMIAAEWDNQTTQLQPTNMPFMTLACTALDQAAFSPDVYQNEALKFLPTDTTCFWADPTEDRLLYRRQDQAWKPLHEYVAATLGGGKHAPSYGIGMEAMLMARKRGSAKPYAGLPHPTPLVDAAKEWTTSLDAWQLVALSSMASQCKSWLIAYALLDTCAESSTKSSNGPQRPFRDMAEAIEASRVEEEFQISIWGMVEGQHDYDRLNASIQILSSQLFFKSILLDNTRY